MLYTASFRTPGLNLVDPRRLVSIARTAPRGFKGRTYPALAPSKELLDWWKGLGKEFRNVYQWPTYAGSYNRDVLRPLLPRIEEVYAELGPDAIMLCWEKYTSDQMCHRFLAARWFEEHLGIAVPEWGLTAG